MEITKKAKQQLTASPAIIDLQGIVKRFYIGKPNELEILHGIDLQVQEDSSYLLSESPVPGNQH